MKIMGFRIIASSYYRDCITIVVLILGTHQTYCSTVVKHLSGFLIKFSKFEGSGGGRLTERQMSIKAKVN